LYSLNLLFHYYVFVCILPEKAVLEMTYTVSGGTLNPTHSLTVVAVAAGYRYDDRESILLASWCTLSITTKSSPTLILVLLTARRHRRS